MNFNTIRYFLMTAQEKSFSRAADRLHITQQTLSGQIAVLEKELGCRLFVRKVPLQLTYGGEVFLDYARRFQEEYRSLGLAFQDISHEARGRLRLGVAYTRGHILLPRVLTEFQSRYPLMEVDIREESNAELLRQLEEGRTDLVVAYFPEDLPGIRTRVLQQEEIWLLVDRRLLAGIYGENTEQVIHRLQETRDARVLRECPFLRTDEADLAGYLVARYLKRLKFQPRQKLKAHNLELLLDMCAAGAGVCFSPDYLVKGFLRPDQRKNLVEIPLGKTMSYPICFGWKEEGHTWSMVEKFMECAGGSGDILPAAKVLNCPWERSFCNTLVFP